MIIDVEDPVFVDHFPAETMGFYIYMLVFPRVSVNWLLGYENNLRISILE